VSCESWQEQTGLLIDGELAEADQVGLFHHLESCPECRTRLASALRCRQAMTRDREEILRGADLLPSAAELLARSRPRATAVPPRRPGRLYGWTFPVPVGVGLALILLLAGALLGARLGRPSSASRATEQAERTAAPAVVVVCGLPEVEVLGSTIRP
jgi:anti-sigma factor RsiW